MIWRYFNLKFHLPFAINTAAKAKANRELLAYPVILVKMRGRGLLEGWPRREVAPFSSTRTRSWSNPRTTSHRTFNNPLSSKVTDRHQQIFIEPIRHPESLSQKFLCFAQIRFLKICLISLHSTIQNIYFLSISSFHSIFHLYKNVI